VALISHLQVAQQNGAASATPIAASSGPFPKAPGSAGGYLLARALYVITYVELLQEGNVPEGQQELLRYGARSPPDGPVRRDLWAPRKMATSTDLCESDF
jgi:hypothetical protein